MIERPIKITKAKDVPKKEDNCSRLYAAYCNAVSVMLELARVLGIKTCSKCGRKV